MKDWKNGTLGENEGFQVQSTFILDKDMIVRIQDYQEFLSGMSEEEYKEYLMGDFTTEEYVD